MSKHILVVEDQPDSRQIIRDMLAATDYGAAMRRRDFIKVVACSTITWPLAARAQQPPLPVVALVNLRSAEGSVRLANAFRKGLNETGWVDGQNVTVEYNWLDGRFNRVSSVIADIVRRRVAVIATPGTIYGTQAAKAA